MLSEEFDPTPPMQAAEELRWQMAELVKRSLLQLGDMQALESQMKELSNRLTEMNPSLKKSNG